MVPCEPNAEHRRLVDHVRIELDIPETRGGRMQRRLRKPDPRPACDLLGRNAEHRLGDQQVIRKIEILGQASAAEPLEDLAITFHHRAQPLPERLVLPLALNVLANCLAHRV